MKDQFLFFLLLAVSLFLFSCEKENFQPVIKDHKVVTSLPAPIIQANGVAIRVVNISSHDLSDLKAEYNFYGSLSNGQTTDYAIVDSIANVPTVSFYLDGTLYKKSIEFCGTGISFFKEGRFTYTIDYIDSDNTGFHVSISQD